MNELALFAGGGGGQYAGKYLLGWRTVCYVEKSRYAGEIIKARIRDCIFDDAPIWDDVDTFDGRPWRGVVDIVTAGFPCQPHSSFGNRLGVHDDRDKWPETKRIISEVGPRFAFLENVVGLLSSGYIFRVLGDLHEIGYSATWDVVPAASVGAPHARRRVWIIAYSDSHGWETNLQQYRDALGPIRRAWWLPPPGHPRVDDGVANRRNRLEATGNGWVPSVAALAWRHLRRRVVV